MPTSASTTLCQKIDRVTLVCVTRKFYRRKEIHLPSYADLSIARIYVDIKAWSG